MQTKHGVGLLPPLLLIKATKKCSKESKARAAGESEESKTCGEETKTYVKASKTFSEATKTSSGATKTCVNETKTFAPSIR